MGKKELLKELRESFKEMKKELGFETSFEELNKIFFFEDFILQAGFVSPNLSRMISSRIVDTFNSWTGRVHSWVVPNPSSMINISESHLFSEEEKKELTKLMNRFMALTSRNSINGLEQDKTEEKRFMDDAVRIWNENKGSLLKYEKKINDFWGKEADDGKTNKQ